MTNAQPSHQPIIESVQDALRRYDGELKSINQKVGCPQNLAEFVGY